MSEASGGTASLCCTKCQAPCTDATACFCSRCGERLRKFCVNSECGILLVPSLQTCYKCRWPQGLAPVVISVTHQPQPATGLSRYNQSDFEGNWNDQPHEVTVSKVPAPSQINEFQDAIHSVPKSSCSDRLINNSSLPLSTVSSSSTNQIVEDELLLQPKKRSKIDTEQPFASQVQGCSTSITEVPSTNPQEGNAPLLSPEIKQDNNSAADYKINMASSNVQSFEVACYGASLPISETQPNFAQFTIIPSQDGTDPSFQLSVASHQATYNPSQMNVTTVNAAQSSAISLTHNRDISQFNNTESHDVPEFHTPQASPVLTSDSSDGEVSYSDSEKYDDSMTSKVWYIV